MDRLLSLMLLQSLYSCSVAVDNLALNKPADQTGVYGGRTADRAVDGILGAPGDKTNCAHPEALGQYAAWWVDLQDTYMIQNVTIYNTYDTSESFRLTMFEISVGPGLIDLTLCQAYTGNVSAGQSVTIQCNDRPGRFVYFRRTGGREPKLVTLCEVQVTGYKPNNLALYKPTGQTGDWKGLTADRAVDGKLGSPGDNTNCAHPAAPVGQYAKWWVDLQDTYRVKEVIIYNTYDSGGGSRLSNFVISVGPSLTDLTACFTYTPTVGNGQSVTIPCNGVGQFVHFQRTGVEEPHLVTLCEVKVTAGYTNCSLCSPGANCSSLYGCSQCPAGKLPPDCVQARPITTTTTSKTPPLSTTGTPTPVPTTQSILTPPTTTTGVTPTTTVETPITTETPSPASNVPSDTSSPSTAATTTTTTATTTAPTNGGGGSLSQTTTTIIIVVVVVVVLISVMAVVGVIYMKRKKKKVPTATLR